MRLNPPIRVLLFVLLAIFMVLTVYGIFNTGNPDSLFRLLVRDRSFDLIITVALAAAVGVLVIVITASKAENPLRNLLEINIDHIRMLRRKGKSEVEIAESFLAELKVSKSGFFFSLAKKRVMRYLSKLR